MGNYERFLGKDLTGDDYVTSGMVYKHVIERERALAYGGKCVEAIPHIRDEIVHRFEHSAKVNKSDISIIEIGGTIGDYQNVMFIEAARVLKMRHPSDVVFVMVSYLPTPGSLGEMKSRPTQNAARQLASYGVNTDFIIARAEKPLDHKRKEKIAISCNIPTEQVISAPDIESIYDVPVNFEKDHLGEILLKTLSLPASKPDHTFDAWKKMAHGIKNNHEREVHIGIVGKYFNTGDFILSDAYLSVIEAIKFSGYAVNVKPVIHTVNARDFEVEGTGKVFPNGADTVPSTSPNRSTPLRLVTGSVGSVGADEFKEGTVSASVGTSPYEMLKKFDGIIVPGGFGESGIEGKLNVIRYARENKIPYFGLCYGMQLMTIEFARNVLGLEGAHTAEIDPNSPHLIIDIMPDQKKKIVEGNYGGSMRLGQYPAKLLQGTIANEAYAEAVKKLKAESGKLKIDKIKGKDDEKDKKFAPAQTILERHRHRYEVNPEYVEQIEQGGMVFSGKSPDGTLMEIAELPSDIHPFFLGTQFHPEFLARPLAPHPLFTEFLKASKKKNKEL
jgi:CTP synthase